MKTASKIKYKLKKYSTGTGDLKGEYDSLSAPEAKRMAGAQGVADGVGSIPVVGAFKTVGEGLGNTFAQRDEYGIAKSEAGAAAGSVFNPLAQTSDLIAGKGGLKGMVGNALIIGGAINKEKELKARKAAAQNRVDIYNRDISQRNVDVEQIGYAKKGLDMSGEKTKYKVKSATKSTSSEPIMTQQERQDLNMLQNNPVVYKQAYQDFIGYKPVGAGTAFAERNSHLYDERVNQHNQRDTSAANFVPFNFQPYAAKASIAATQNNLNHPSTNKRLDKYIVDKGGEVSNMGGYKKGTKSINTKMVKPVEVEGDEILMEKSRGKYKMKADFKNGPTHEQGGIPIIAEEGDIIYPANKREQVIDAYEDNNHSKLESMRKQLPTDTNYKKATGSGGVGYGYKKTSGFKNVNTSSMGVGAGTSSVGSTGVKTGGIGGKTNWGKIGTTAAEFAPIAYNIGKGLFGKSEKTNRRLYNPEEFQYTDISQPIRNEAVNAYTGEKDQIRNAAGGSAGNYLAAQSLANSRKYQRLQDINNNEGGRKVAVANMNTELKNNSKMANLNLQNQYDELDLRNDAAKKKHLTDGFSQLSTAAQNKQRMRNMADADDIRARTLQDMVSNYGFDPNALKDKDKDLYNFKKEKGTSGIKGKYKMKKSC